MGKNEIFPFYLSNLWPVTHDSGNMCKAIVVVWRKIELSVCPSRQQLLLKCWGSHRWCFNNNVSPARCWGYQESSELSTIHQGLSRESLSFLWSKIFRIQGLFLWMACKKDFERFCNRGLVIICTWWPRPPQNTEIVSSAKIWHICLNLSHAIVPVHT